jgi:hypothetical protein
VTDVGTKILEARRRGLPLTAIARSLKLTDEEARAAYDQAIADERVSTDEDEQKLLDLSRIDRMIQGVYPNAVTGDNSAVAEMIKLMELRNRLIGKPGRVKNSVAEAFERSLAALREDPQSRLDVVDEALIVSARNMAQQIDYAVAYGTQAEVSKAMYLVPQLMGILRELGATPASRAALRGTHPEPLPNPDADDKEAPVDLADWKRRARDS